MSDYSKTDDKSLCVLLREQLVEMDKAKTINLYQMTQSGNPAAWEHGARFVSEPCYWRHNIAGDIQKQVKAGTLDLSAWPLAAEVVRRWGDKAITVRCSRRYGSAWSTRFNGTEQDAKSYFMGHTGTGMHLGKEIALAPVVKVEVLDA